MLSEAVAWARPFQLLLVVLGVLLLVTSCCCLRCCCRRLCCRRGNNNSHLKGRLSAEFNYDDFRVDISPHVAGNNALEMGSDDGFSQEDSEGATAARTEAASAATTPRSTKPGKASQVCSYEELGESNLSDCSAESADFEGIFDPPTHRAAASYSASRSAKAVSNGTRAARRSAARTEKRSLLTDMDVLVT